jgi:hypothetical protein
MAAPMGLEGAESDDPLLPPACVIPTRTPTPTPTDTLSPTPTFTITPTPTEEECLSDPPTDWNQSVGFIFLAVPNTDPQAYEVSLGTYIGGDRHCFLSHSHWPTYEYLAFTFINGSGQTGWILWPEVSYERISLEDGQSLFCLGDNLPPDTAGWLVSTGVSPQPENLYAHCGNAYMVDGEYLTVSTELIEITIEDEAIEDHGGNVVFDWGFSFHPDQLLEGGDSGSPISVSGQIVGIYAGGSPDIEYAVWVHTP